MKVETTLERLEVENAAKDMRRKTIYTLNLNYPQEITDLTYPLLDGYANKIGARFEIINHREWSGLPLTYEKFQVASLSASLNDEWSFYIDSDALIHPDAPDVTELIGKDTVLFNGADFAPNRWTYDEYFRRDGRYIGACTWFVVWSEWCRDLWRPLDDITIDEAIARIHPTAGEMSRFDYERDANGNQVRDKDGAFRTIPKTVITAAHLIDDYILSRNIARFGLKHKTWIDLKKELGDPGNYSFHVYWPTVPQKVEQMKTILKQWMLR